MSRTDTEIAVIGGGLSGLATAEALARAGRDLRVLEARERLGGRILSAGPGVGFDMGPAWIWPHNRRALALAKRLGLSAFEQFSTGRLVFQDPSRAVRRDLDFAPMAGSLRIDGELARLVDGLAAKLPTDRLIAGHQVRAVDTKTDGVTITTAKGALRARLRRGIPSGRSA